jgi:hypothetical protein
VLVIEGDVPGPFSTWCSEAKDELQRILSERAARVARDLCIRANRWSLWEWVGPWGGRRDPASVRDTTRNLHLVSSAESLDGLIVRLARRQSWVFQRCEKVAILESSDQDDFILRTFHRATDSGLRTHSSSSR